MLALSYSALYTSKRCTLGPNHHPIECAYLIVYYLASQLMHVEKKLELRKYSPRDFIAFPHDNYFFFMYSTTPHLPLCGCVLKSRVTSRIYFYMGNIYLRVHRKGVAETGMTRRWGHIVCRFFKFIF